MSPVLWLRAVAVIGATALLMASSCSWQLGTPIPEGVPPPAGDPVPQIDTHAKGRPADQLHDWAAERAPALGIPVDGAGGLRVRGQGRRGGEPRLPSDLAHARGHRHGGKPSRHLSRRDHRAERRRHAVHPGRAAGRHDGQPRDRRQRFGACSTATPAWTGRWARCSSSPRRGGSTGSTPTTTARSARTTSTTRRCRRRAICAGAARISSTPRGWMNALRAYNLSDQYARTVRDWATAYADGHPALIAPSPTGTF